ncbi:MAG: hypothetical protein WC963_05360 [Bacilli bacterium]|jgi:hypothetical protein
MSYSTRVQEKLDKGWFLLKELENLHDFDSIKNQNAINDLPVTEVKTETDSPCLKSKEVNQPQDIIDYFKIDQTQAGIILFFNDHEKYTNSIQKIDDFLKIEDFLSKHKNEDSNILSRNLDAYKNRLQKTKEKIIIGKIEQNELSEKLTNTFISVIERYFIYKIIDSSYRALTVKKMTWFYKPLIKLCNEYLNKLGIYSFDSDNIQLGQKLSDTYLEYFNIETFEIDDESLHGKIREIQLLPYFFPFKNEYNEYDEYWIRGKILINKYKESK